MDATARRLRTASRVLAVLAMVPALFAVVGWVSGNRDLIQVRPALGWAPMQMTTALGLILCCLSVIHRRRWAWGGLGIGLCTILSYMTGASLLGGLLPNYVTDSVAIPGVGAPNTATAIVLISTGILWSRAGNHEYVGGLLTFLGLCIGAVGLSGYAAQAVSLYDMGGDFTGMAMNTAGSITVLGTAAFIRIAAR